MLPQLIERIRELPNAKLNEGISSEELEKFESNAKLRLPDAVREFYSLCNGVELEVGMELLSLAKADEMREIIDKAGLGRSWRHVPLTENNDSNPVCICCEGPLAGYLIHVFHDDVPILKWRTFEGFLGATLDHVENDGFSFEEVRPDFLDDNRTERDILTAKALLLHAQMLPQDHVERHDACLFASWLLDSKHLAEVAQLLETEDEYVRREICDRLEVMPGEDPRRCLGEYKKKFKAFLVLCQGILKANGILTSVDSVLNFELSEHSLGLNMDALYTERGRPDFETFFVQRVNHLIVQSQKVS